MDIYILTFHPNIQYELKEVFGCIGTTMVARLIWGVERLDWLGTKEAGKFNREVDTSPGYRKLVPGERLLNLSAQVWQTIEGEFVGYRSEQDARQFLKTGSPFTWFPTSTAELAIEVKDGSIFDMYLREKKYADKLSKHFQKVYWQDPSNFILKSNE